MGGFDLKTGGAPRSRTAEDAYWQLLQNCASDPQGPLARRYVARVINSGNPEWAYEVLYASYLLAAKDIDRPEAPLVALVTDSEQKELVDIIVRSGSAEQMYHTMRTVFLYSKQKGDMLRALKRSKSRMWAREALADLRLTPEQCAILTGR